MTAYIVIAALWFGLMATGSISILAKPVPAEGRKERLARIAIFAFELVMVFSAVWLLVR